MWSSRAEDENLYIERPRTHKCIHQPILAWYALCAWAAVRCWPCTCYLLTRSPRDIRLALKLSLPRPCLWFHQPSHHMEICRSPAVVTRYPSVYSNLHEDLAVQKYPMLVEPALPITGVFQSPEAVTELSIKEIRGQAARKLHGLIEGTMRSLKA
jgi:hypothetical protein